MERAKWTDPTFNIRWKMEEFGLKMQWNAKLIMNSFIDISNCRRSEYLYSEAVDKIVRVPIFLHHITVVITFRPQVVSRFP